MKKKRLYGRSLLVSNDWIIDFWLSYSNYFSICSSFKRKHLSCQCDIVFFYYFLFFFSLFLTLFLSIKFKLLFLSIGQSNAIINEMPSYRQMPWMIAEMIFMGSESIKHFFLFCPL